MFPPEAELTWREQRTVGGDKRGRDILANQ